MSAVKKTTGRKTEVEYDLITAAASGDRLETLIALRDLLAERLQSTSSSRDISSMSRRLMQCVEEIEAIDKARKARGSFSLDDFRRDMGIRTLARPAKNAGKEILENEKKVNKGHRLGKLSREHENY